LEHEFGKKKRFSQQQTKEVKNEDKLKIKDHSSDESDSSSSSVSGEIRDFDQKRNFPFGESSNETNKKKRKKKGRS